MTRINVVPPSELTRAHLMAEYRELPRAMRRAVLATYKGKQPSDIDIAPAYKLGKGHELFFVDKCRWLYDRWVQLRTELLARGYNLGDKYQTIVQGRARYVRVDVDDPEESEKVRMRIPLGFLRNGLRLGTMLPERIRARLEAQGFQGLFLGIGEEDDLVKVLDALNIDVDEGDGRRVRIYCE